MPTKARQLLNIVRRPDLFTRALNNIQLRPYQIEPLNAILDSVYHHRGDTFILIFSRQSGKDELLANLIVYLLYRLHGQSASIICAQPTFNPQTILAMARLEARLNTLWFKKMYERKGGCFYCLGRARCTYYSADPTANVVGATARTLLIVNEAQDVDARVYDKNFAPMAAAGNATKIFCGTSWTSNTLLSRELRFAEAAQKADGRRRVFIVTGEEVSRCNPYYARHMAGELARFGRNHPLIRTQYFCEEIDAQAGMFPPGRQALMHGSHPPLTAPEPGKTYAFLIDVAGQDECAGQILAATAPTDDMSHRRAIPPLLNPARDCTSLKIVEIDRSTLPVLGKPVYKVVLRRSWTGEKHVKVFGALRAYVQTWKPFKVVIDATGVGEGLWSLLDNAFGDHIVIPVKFTASLKSELGYGFLAIVESGRYQEYSPFDATLHLQLDQTISEIVPGPAKLLRWGVPDGTRDHLSRALVHDDDLITSALCAILDRLQWSTPLPSVIVPGRDPLKSMDRRF